MHIEFSVYIQYTDLMLYTITYIIWVHGSISWKFGSVRSISLQLALLRINKCRTSIVGRIIINTEFLDKVWIEVTRGSIPMDIEHDIGFMWKIHYNLKIFILISKSITNLTFQI